MTEPEGPLAVAGRVARAFEHAGVEYAVGGALAWMLWCKPRMTHDVDFNLFLHRTELDRALDALSTAGVSIDRAEACRRADEGAVLVGRAGLMRVDLFTPSIPFSWEAARTRVRASLGPLNAWFLSAEATAVFKLLFFRGKDLLDLEALVVQLGDRLDVAYVRRWMVEMMGADDERVVAWDRMTKA